MRFGATGSMSKYYSRLEAFIPYARDAFTNGGRDMVFGVFSHWKGTPHMLTAAHSQNAPQLSRETYWTKRCGRTAVTIVLRRLPTNRIQLVIFDPSMRHPWAREPLTMTTGLWNGPVIQQLKQAFNTSATGVWCGGRVSNRMGQLGIRLSDSVQLSCGFVWDVATGRFDTESLEDMQFDQQ
ncbi:Uu.00g012870.m01.CDS01 [Anthostomella pinea]|uniref:Uu.00g012870.m01.CDS01 n=1 Tax=Anthostomella pinea TaxID=933095 RepID=A0AAI8VZ94_9PEZI|nr:Uu.00g012870.m01.CDS01 [Anthostomella pinea]